MKGARTSIALSVLLLLGGCMKRSEGERLGRELEAQTTRMSALETQVSDLSTREQAHYDELVAQIEGVRGRLDDLRGTIEASGRGSADLGANLDSLRELAQRLDGRLAEMDQNIAAAAAQVREQDAQLDQQIRLLAQRTGVDISLSDADIPADRAAHFTAGTTAFDAGDHARARALFGEYGRRYPTDDKADDAQLYIAKSYQAQQQWQRAIGTYREFARNQAQSELLDQALFGMSQCFYELHDCANARTALDAIKQTRPRSPMIRQVDARIRELRSPPRGYCTSG